MPENTGREYTGAQHGEPGHTEGVDLRGSSVATNADDVSMDVTDGANDATRPEGRSGQGTGREADS